MPIYYWKGATGSEELLSTHRDTIERILRGDYNPQDLKKLTSPVTPAVYRFKLNDTERLLFTTYRGCLHILEHLPTHDYHKSRFLKKGVLPRFLEANSHKDASDLFSPLSDTEGVPRFDVTTRTELADAPDVIGLDYYNQKFMHLSASQAEIRHQKTYPMLLNGVAGTGKTYVGLSLLSDEIHHHNATPPRCLYVSKEPYLVAHMAQNWRSGFARTDSDESSVEFNTYHEVMGLPLDETQVEAAFNTWFDSRQLKSNHWPQLTDKVAFYREFCICAGFSKAEYLELGARQSALPKDTRDSFYDFFQRFLESMHQQGILNSDFAFIDRTPEYDFIVVDEAQNFTLVQLQNLSRLARAQRIVFCMDPHQNVFDTLSFRALLEYRFRLNGIPLRRTQLDETHRYTHEIAKTLDQLIEMGRIIQGGVVDKEEARQTRISSDAPRGTFALLSPDQLHSAHWLMEQANTTEFAVVTTPAFVDDARARFNTPLVFTPEQIIGQEFHTVVAYKFLDTDEARRVLKANRALLLDQTTKAPQHLPKISSNECYQFTPWLHQLFIAYSRAVNTLVVVDAPSKLNQPFLARLNSDTQALTPVQSSAYLSTNWSSMALMQRQRGNETIAQQIENKVLAQDIKAADIPEKAPVIKKARKKNKKTIEALPTLDQVMSQITWISNSNPAPKIYYLYDKELQKTLFQAIENNNINEIERLIKLPQVDFDDIDSSDCTPLMIAAQKGYEDIAGLLLNHVENLKINKAKKSGFTAFTLAAQNGHAGIVKLLLDQNVEVISQHGQYSGCIALVLAAQNGHYDVVKLLLDLGTRIDINFKIYDGSTALILAAKRGRKNTVELLLEQGARLDINATSSDGYSALINACGLGHDDVVRVMLAQGDRLNINQRALSGQTALFFAAEGGHDKVVELLLTQVNRLDINTGPSDNYLTPFLVAALNGRLSVINLLLSASHQFPMDKQVFSQGSRALVVAVKNNRHLVTQALLNEKIILKQVIQDTIKMFNEKPSSKDLAYTVLGLLKAPLDVWAMMRSAEELDLSEDAHFHLLQTIQDSKNKDRAEQHPLYKVLSAVKKSGNEFFSAKTPLEELDEMIQLRASSLMQIAVLSDVHPPI